MDASRLLAVLNDVEADYKDGLLKLITGLVQQYTTARDSPTTDNAPAIQKAYNATVEHINNSCFSQYPPSKAGVLNSIGGEKRVGPGLKQRLEVLLSISGQTTAGIVTALNALMQDVEAFRKSCAQTKAGLEALGLSPHTIPSGEFEVGILIPEGLVGSKLSSLVKELGEWNKIVRGFQEVAGEEEREVTVAGLAKGSYEVYLPLGLVAASYLSTAIDKILEWYSKILEIRKHRQELKELGAPIAESSAIQKHEKEIIDNGIQNLAKEIVKASQLKLDASRKHELETHLTISIRYITRFVDRGGTVEVDSTPPEDPEKPEEIDAASATSEEQANHEHLLAEYNKLTKQYDNLTKTLSAGRALRRLPPRPEPILQLEFDTEGDDTPIERAHKKKGEKS